MNDLIPRASKFPVFASEQDLKDSIDHFLMTWPGWSVIQNAPPTNFPATAKTHYDFHVSVLELNFDI